MFSYLLIMLKYVIIHAFFLFFKVVESSNDYMWIIKRKALVNLFCWNPKLTN
jgi:hypothetical protein